MIALKLASHHREGTQKLPQANMSCVSSCQLDQELETQNIDIFMNRASNASISNREE